MARSVWILVLGGGLTLGVGRPALAQPTGSLAHPPWPRVQQGFEDVEPLAVSLAVHQVDLRTPIGFEHVYDLGDGRFARIDGGLIAVFPRSTYTGSRSGVRATIPPGATFYLGMPPDVERGPDAPFHRSAIGPAQGPDRRVPDARAQIAVPDTSRAPALADPIPSHRPSRPPQTMFNSEAERHRVVSTLLERARSRPTDGTPATPERVVEPPLSGR